MISTGNSDYRSLFEIKEATKLTTEPTFESLTNLQDQLKINAQAIPSVLGGGNHGHLGLVVSNAEYQMITLTPFVRPTNPGVFVLTPQMQNMPVDQIELLRQQHNTRLALYNQVEQVESALKQFITDSIPQEYLLALRHTVTKKLTGSIPNIMRQLFNTYGNITAQSFMEKQNVLNNHVYDTSKPVDTVFNLAKDYQDYAAAFGNPQPQGTIITTCYNIFRKTGRFNSALQKWNEKADVDKTWDNFKAHFRQASQHLREFAPTTMADAGYNQQMANAIAEGLASKMQEPTQGSEQAETFIQNISQAVDQNQQMLPQLFQSLHLMSDNITALQNDIHSLNAATIPRRPPNQPPMQQQPPPMQAPPFQQPPPPTYAPHVNAPPGYNGFVPPPPGTQFNPPPPVYQQRFVSGRGAGRGGGRGRYGGRGGRGGGNRGYAPKQQQQNHFCWSHGYGNHPSGQCRNPFYGHQWSATAKDPMGSPHAPYPSNQAAMGAYYN